MITWTWTKTGDGWEQRTGDGFLRNMVTKTKSGWRVQHYSVKNDGTPVPRGATHARTLAGAKHYADTSVGRAYRVPGYSLIEQIRGLDK